MEKIKLKEPHIIINAKTKLRKKPLLNFLTNKINNLGRVSDFKSRGPYFNIWCEVHRDKINLLLNDLQKKPDALHDITINKRNAPETNELLLVCVTLSHDKPFSNES